MKKSKSKSARKTARKALFKDIKLRLINALNEATGVVGQGSKKLRKVIRKGAKKFAKKISKQITRNSLKKADTMPAPVIKPNARTNITRGISKPVSTNTRLVQKRQAAKNTNSSVASSATAAKRVKSELQGSLKSKGPTL